MRRDAVVLVALLAAVAVGDGGSDAASSAAAPQAPSGLTCANATPTSITLRWAEVPGADMYDLQCASAASTKPFVSVGSPSTAATVTSLLPSAALTCQVRAHHFAATGFYHRNTLVGGWSALSEPKVRCATVAGDPPPPPASAPPSNPSDGRATQRVQMWRVSEYNYTKEEDYLQNHDSGDLNGEKATISLR